MNTSGVLGRSWSIPLRWWVTAACLVVLSPMIAFSGWVMQAGLVEQQRLGIEALGRQASDAAAAIGREFDSVCTELAAVSLESRDGPPGLSDMDALARRMVNADSRLQDISVLHLDQEQTQFASESPIASRPQTNCSVSTFNASSGGSTPSVTVTYTSAGKRVSAVVVATALQSTLTDQHWPDDWTAAILDQGGVIAARSHDAKRYVGQPSTPGLLRAVTDSTKAFRATTKDGIEVITRGAQVGNIGWYVVAGRPKAQLDSQVWKSMEDVSLWAAASALLGVVVAAFTAKSIATQLNSVVDAHILQQASPSEQPSIREIRQVSKALGAARASVSRAFAEVDNARAQALAQLRERSEMLDVLAHEVRQPLNNASAALQEANAFISSRRSNADVGAPLLRAKGVLSAVTESVDNTLAVASLLAGHERPCRIDFDLDTLVSVVLEDLAPDQAGRVEIERDTQTRTASMDPNLMRLALRNLLSNALKFSSKGTRVVLRIADSDDPLGVSFDVIDSGPGVDPGRIDTLFERGGHRSASIGGRRHGLGLYIVGRVMQIHGGLAQLIRNGPDGATFRVLLNQGVEDDK